MRLRRCSPSYLGFLPPLANRKARVDEGSQEQQHPVRPADLAVKPQQIQKRRHADHDRNIKTHHLPRHDQRSNRCRSAQDEQHVEDIAANNIAYCDVRLPAESRLDAHRQLRSTRAVGDHCQSDH
jgi:hypothetical protein